MSNFFGHVDPAFARVREVFEANFEEGSAWPEVGAAYSVCLEGKEVVNLWGGVADQESGRLWEADTRANVFSSGKALPAIAIAQLVGEGRIAYDDPVAKHWPEFEANGKGGITISHIMSHRSGVNAFDAPIAIDDLGDWNDTVARLAGQAPIHAPGEKTAYHALTYGHLAMEVVRRVTGLMPRDYVAQHIAGPLGAEISVGADQTIWAKIATLVPPPPPPADRPMPDPLAAKAIMNPMITPPLTATPAWRNAQIPGANAHVSARGLARMWGAIANGGEIDEVRILTPEAIGAMSALVSDAPCMMMGPMNWAQGVIRNRAGLFGPRDGTFGNCGFGGSQGFADVDLKVAAAYVPNRMFPNLLQDPRAMALANAVFESVGKAGA